MSNQTIDYYNENANTFFESTIDADMSHVQQQFAAYLPKDALILDAGCGSGRDSKAFLNLGYRIEAMDASAQLCQLASQYLQQEVACMTFQEIDAKEKYQGIWACASLLHIPKEELPDVLSRFHQALQKDGILYASVKCGTHSAVEKKRFFQYYEEAEFKQCITNAGFQILNTYLSQDVRKDKQTTWINVFAKKIDSCQKSSNE